MPLRRPRAVILTVSSLVVVGIVAAVGLTGCGAARISTVGQVEFDQPLAIPPLAESEVDEDGVRHFSLTAQSGSSEFVPGVDTPTSGFNGVYLGPTLRAERGERIGVHIENELAVETTVHWHGMHLPPEMDGGPHQPIAPGDTWDPNWTIDQPAATLWYHPHPHGETEQQVRDGMAGLFYIDDPDERALPLPREYGVDDVPVVVQDVNIGRDGEFDKTSHFVGSLGEQLLVNGTIGPYLDVETDVIRLRLVNASTARVYGFGFADGREFHQIASDGGLLEAPLVTTGVQLSPGERAEVLVTMTPGERVVLQSVDPDLGGTIGFVGGDDGGSDSFDVLELRAAQTLRHAGEVPDALVPVERLDPDTVTKTRSFTLDGTQINSENMAMDRIDEVVELGATEVWTVTNNMAFPHNFHVHDVQFQVLDIAGEAPPAALAGWKDTVYLRPNEAYRLIMRFTDYADPDHPYMYHCHLLRHEDNGMMGQFLVVTPGTTVPSNFEGESHHEH